MFRALSAIDYVTLLRKIRISFEEELKREKLETDVRRFYMAEELMERLRFMEDKSLKQLLIATEQVVKHPTSPVKFVGDVLLSEFFSEYTKTPQTEIWEVWNYNSEQKYSAAEYESYPPWLQKTFLQEKYGAKEADEFIVGTFLSDELRTKNIHLDFILEALEAEIEQDVLSTIALN